MTGLANNNFIKCNRISVYLGTCYTFKNRSFKGIDPNTCSTSLIKIYFLNKNETNSQY